MGVIWKLVCDKKIRSVGHYWPIQDPSGSSDLTDSVIQSSLVSFNTAFLHSIWDSRIGATSTSPWVPDLCVPTTSHKSPPRHLLSTSNLNVSEVFIVFSQTLLPQSTPPPVHVVFITSITMHLPIPSSTPYNPPFHSFLLSHIHLVSRYLSFYFLNHQKSKPPFSVPSAVLLAEVLLISVPYLSNRASIWPVVLSPNTDLTIFFPCLKNKFPLPQERAHHSLHSSVICITCSSPFSIQGTGWKTSFLYSTGLLLFSL